MPGSYQDATSSAQKMPQFLLATPVNRPPRDVHDTGPLWSPCHSPSTHPFRMVAAPPGCSHGHARTVRTTQPPASLPSWLGSPEAGRKYDSSTLYLVIARLRGRRLVIHISPGPSPPHVPTPALFSSFPLIDIDLSLSDKASPLYTKTPDTIQYNTSWIWRLIYPPTTVCPIKYYQYIPA